MSQRRLLIVDDEPALRFAMGAFFEGHGFRVSTSASIQDAKATITGQRFDAAVVDFELADGTVLDNLPSLAPHTPIVVLTGHGSVERAVSAMQVGAEQFLLKPIELPVVLAILNCALERALNRRQVASLAPRPSRRRIDPFVGTSVAINTLKQRAMRLVDNELAVLIKGPTGSGKTVLARWLHENGPRAHEAFIDLNCASLPKELVEAELFGVERGAYTGAEQRRAGLIESADRGTLFLDEIGDLDVAVQPKLLKVLEEQRIRRLGGTSDALVDVRLVSATHQSFEKLVAAGRFRQDLLFRLATVELTVPSLAQRREDIPILARAIMEDVDRVGRPGLSIDDETLVAMQAYHWPGNLRELRNVLERAAIWSDDGVIRVRDLASPSQTKTPPSLRAPDPSESMTLAELEAHQIKRVLAAVDGHIGQAAKRLGILRSSLYDKVKRLGLKVTEAGVRPSLVRVVDDL